MLHKVSVCLKKVATCKLVIITKQLQTPFVIYADFDSNQQDIQKPNRDNAGASYTDKCQEHIACSYG